MKNSTECIYDVSSQKDDDGRDGSSQNAHGVKRRREMPRTLEEDVDELQSLYGQLRRAESTGEKPDPSAIESRLDKLMSMIERLGGSGQTLEDVGMQVTALDAKVGLVSSSSMRMGFVSTIIAVLVLYSRMGLVLPVIMGLIGSCCRR